METPKTPKKTKKEVYSIIVGGTPKTGLTGVFRNGKLQGSVTEVLIDPQPVLIQANSSVWAKKRKDENGNYNGELEFLKWGDEQGELTNIFYRKGHQSLDVNYQRNVLKLNEPRDEEISVVLLQGYNDFVVLEDRALCQFLKVHHENKDSISRRQGLTEFSFENYKHESYVDNEKDIQKYEETSAKYLTEAEEDEDKLDTFGEIFNGKITLDAIKINTPKEVKLNILWSKRNHDKVQFVRILEGIQEDFKDKCLTALSVKLASFENGFLYLLVNGEKEKQEKAPAISKEQFANNLFYFEYYTVYMKLTSLLNKIK